MKQIIEQFQTDVRNGWKADFSCPAEMRFFKMRSAIHACESELHRIEIVDLEQKGRALFLNDCARVFAADEYIYHEALVHPIMQFCIALQRPIRVLIIGDGDGGAVRELLRFPQVQHITWVEIDSLVVESCFDHLGLLPRAALNDPRLSLICGDGCEYMRATNLTFDAVIISVSENQSGGPAAPLYAKEFYSAVQAVLVDDGVFGRSLCSLTPADNAIFRTYCSDVRRMFPFLVSYSVGLPAFGIDWGFVVASRKDCLNTAWDCQEVPSRIFNAELFKRAIVRTALSVSDAYGNS